MSRLLAVSAVALLAGCAGAPPTVEVSAEACEAWPDTTAHPRAGFYLYERSIDPYWGDAANELYRFDGDTITMRFIAAHTLEPDCSYGRLDGMPSLSVQRFHAHVDERGYLFALEPCHGWTRVGQLTGDRLETPLMAVLRRVPAGDRSALITPFWDEALVREFFRCRPIWVHPDLEMPPRPQ